MIVVKNGSVSLAKALMDHEVWHLEPFSRGQAWVDLILAANDSNRTFLAQGRPVEVFRGQTGYSLKSLARRWKWSDEKVSGFIQWLERGGMIARRSNGVTTLITILNYDTYNSSKPDTETDAGADTETGTRTGTAPATGTEQKVEGGSKEEGRHTPRVGVSPDWAEVEAFAVGAKVDTDFARDWFERKFNDLSHGFDTLRDWRFDLLTWWRRNGSGKKPAAGDVVNGHKFKSLELEIMDAERSRKRLVAAMAEHPCNEQSAAYDPASLEYPAWQSMLVAHRAAEAALRSIPREGVEDWMLRLRKEAFQRALAEHPGNPESAAHDEDRCTEETRQQATELRRECV